MSVEGQGWALEGSRVNTPAAELRLGRWSKVGTKRTQAQALQGPTGPGHCPPSSDQAHIAVTPWGVQCQGEGEVGDGEQKLWALVPQVSLASESQGLIQGAGRRWQNRTPGRGHHVPIVTTASLQRYCHAQTACGKRSYRQKSEQRWPEATAVPWDLARKKLGGVPSQGPSSAGHHQGSAFGSPC